MTADSASRVEVEPADAWAVVVNGKINVKTISDTRRAAIINWLLVEKEMVALYPAADNQIEDAWEVHRGEAKAIQIIASAPSPVDLDGLEKLCEAATPGPWKLCYDGQIDGPSGETICRFTWDSFKEFNDHPAERANARFIAAARTALPKALAEIRRRAGGVEAPAGWRLVPEEPTPEMVDAGREAMSKEQFVSHARAIWVWIDMLSAAPEPPKALALARLVEETVKVLEGVIAVADRRTTEFDAARALLAKLIALRDVKGTAND